MSREIRFRAWDNINKKYIPHEYLECCIKNINKNNSGKKQFDYEQYTGLNDKSGVYIFEGDLIRVVIKNSSDRVISDYIAEIVYQDAKYNLYTSGRIKTHLAGYSMSWTTFEVVGNIHQNEDLLK